MLELLYYSGSGGPLASLACDAVEIRGRDLYILRDGGFTLVAHYDGQNFALEPTLVPGVTPLGQFGLTVRSIAVDADPLQLLHGERIVAYGKRGFQFEARTNAPDLSEIEGPTLLYNRGSVWRSHTYGDLAGTITIRPNGSRPFLSPPIKCGPRERLSSLASRVSPAASA
jgi:hypothetical protein